MKILTTKHGYFLLYLLLSFLASTILCILIYADLKNDLAHNLKSISILYNPETHFDSKLYYSLDNTFNEERVLHNLSNVQGKLLFALPGHDSILTSFRLDLNPKMPTKHVTIKGLVFTFTDKVIQINSSELSTVFFRNSASVGLNKELSKITFLEEHKPFDPYIVFNPVAEIIKGSYPFIYALCAPFVILGILLLLKLGVVRKTTIFEVLTMLFFVAIPLKIAWTTLMILLIVVYLVFEHIKTRKKPNHIHLSLFFLGVFLIPLVFGRPRGIEDFDIQMGFVVFAFLGAFFDKNVTILYKQYIVAFCILFTMVLSFGMVFLSNFELLYGLPIREYFTQIKTYGGNVRNWLYFDHAAFLSFFGLVGLLFVQDLYNAKEATRPILILYHLLLCGFLIFTGARICLIIYLIYCCNFLLKYRHLERLIANGIVYAGFAIFLLKNIASYDFYRSELWKKSWTAIEQQPFFGYGLGRSNEVLHNEGLVGLDANTFFANLNHSHNQFITFLLEIGFFGTIALSVFVLYLIYMKKWYRNTTFILFAFGTLYLMFTESVFQTSKPIYVLCFLMIVILRAPQSKRTTLMIR